METLGQKPRPKPLNLKPMRVPGTPQNPTQTLFPKPKPRRAPGTPLNPEPMRWPGVRKPHPLNPIPENRKPKTQTAKPWVKMMHNLGNLFGRILGSGGGGNLGQHVVQVQEYQDDAPHHPLRLNESPKITEITRNPPLYEQDYQDACPPPRLPDQEYQGDVQN